MLYSNSFAQSPVFAINSRQLKYLTKLSLFVRPESWLGIEHGLVILYNNINAHLLWIVFQAPSSPSGSLNMSSPVDYNSYSPQESYSSSCYNSPTRLDLSYGFVPEHYHYQHCNLQHCYCLSHWSGTQESICTPEYAIYGTTDCVHASPVDGSYFRRELSSSEICYL